MKTQYRVDIVPKQVAGTDYKVPCGMNSIVSIYDTSSPNPFHARKSFKKKEDTEVYIYSKWNEKESNFVVYLIQG